MSEKDKSKAIGGKARAEALTPAARKEIAKKAAAARWGERPMRATHKGSFRDEFGFDVECYVLDDDQKLQLLVSEAWAKLWVLAKGEAGSQFLFGDKKSLHTLGTN